MSNEHPDRKIAILLLEDNPADATLLQHVLAKSGIDLTVQVVNNEVDFQQQALKVPYDIVLADYNLPQYNAFQALQYLQENNIDVPFIIVSGSIGEELAVDIMRQGATDYLLKDRLGRLGAAIKKAFAEKLQKTERRKIEEAYRKSEKRYRSMFHNDHTVMLFIDPENGAIIDANPAAEVFYGWTREQLMDTSILEIDKSTDLASMQNLRKSASGHKPNYQASHLAADGQLRNVEIKSCPISVGDRLLLFVIISDVSAHKSMESLINNVFQSMGEALTVIDRDYNVIVANRAYCEQSGYSLEELIGMRCYCTPEPEPKFCEGEGVSCPAAVALKTGRPAAKTFSRQDAEGQTTYLDIKAFPMKDDVGKVASIIMVFNDITEQKKLEAQLRQSQKMEAIGTLTGGIAHDFNNILTAIIGNATLLSMKMEDKDPLVRFVDNIQEATDRATTLTQGLLAFSRKQVINPVSVNLNKTILGMERLLQRVISEDIVLRTDLLQQDINVLVDQSQLEQVIMNLVVNGRDAIEDGGEIYLTSELTEIDGSFVETHGFGDLGSYAMVRVKDTGSGMDQATVERVFEPFFTTKDVGKGTGLGLSTAYGIIKQHNGFIICNSEIKKGTEFQLYLPLTERENEVAQSEEVLYEGGTETILLVEDDQNVRMMLREVLQESGYRIETAAGGTEAIEKFKHSSNDVQLLILDVIMPGMNGKEVFIELEKIKPGIKAIFISGYTGDIIHQKGIMEEHIHFLAKPLSPRDLLNKVREVLNEPA
jgi:two-component system cell cycle sensor histidine kinase/response regulator CckA